MGYKVLQSFLGASINQGALRQIPVSVRHKWLSGSGKAHTFLIVRLEENLS